MKWISILYLFGACATLAYADAVLVDCTKGSLAQTVTNAKRGDIVVFTGVCSGPIVVTAARLTLKGSGNSVIDGQGKDALTIAARGDDP